MKKIYSNIKTLAALLVAGAAFTACSSSDSDNIIEQPENPSAKTYKLTVQASLEGTQASTRGSIDGPDGNNTLKLTWDSNDVVYVFNNNASGFNLGDYINRDIIPNEIGELSPQHSGNINGSNAQLFGNVTYGNYEKLTLTYGDHDYLNQDGTLGHIATNCNYAIATVTLTRIEQYASTFETTPAYFKNQQAIIKLRLNRNNNPIMAETFSIKKGENVLCSFKSQYDGGQSINDVYLAIPSVSKSDNIRIEAGSYHKDISDITLEKGKYYTMTVAMDKN